ncbi:substrate-binding periplasmic protein [Alteromonas facilis]|uniref:substrate-binding periplasmic protein n=1 Tax=Alteromonas facilis TaxID=2048004 RepID=UPI000C28A01A|nr:transporter substrate-binding domain-containing protein [Alteromonas facilis]
MPRASSFLAFVGLIGLVLLPANATANASQKPLRFYSELVAPYYWLDESGTPQGAAIDLAEALLNATHLPGTVSHLPWARAFHEAQNRPDIVLLTALKTTARVPELQWIGKVGVAEAYLIGVNDGIDSISDLEQAKSLRIATIRGYGSARYLQEHGFVEGENLDLFVRIDQLWSMLYRHRVDAVLMNLTTSPFEIAEAGLDPNKIKPLLAIDALTVDLEMATGHQTPTATVEVLRKGLETLKQSGEYQAIMARWGLKYDHPPLNDGESTSSSSPGR